MKVPMIDHLIIQRKITLLKIEKKTGVWSNKTSTER